MSGEAFDPVTITWVLSQGHEDKLTDCQYASYDDCEASEAAGVICEVDGMLVCILYIWVVLPRTGKMSNICHNLFFLELYCGQTV